MGFYGNITNTSKTNFVFDKIYTNRKAMDENIAKDGIFIGRYVLVEYGQITNDSFIRAYGPKEDGYYHVSDDKEEITRILYTANKNEVEGRYITNGIVIYTITKNNNKDIYNYYECNGETEDGRPAFANNPGLDPNNDPYFFNFNQDKQKYDTSRGYDGTVWVKTSVNNEIKYVNIAELNSVVPSFEIVADAPTMSPILPHFDTASNNVYYKLHWQPAWGVRVAEADNPERSDYKTAWSQEFYNKETGEAYTKWYNPATGEWDSDSPCEIIADIYFNKAAFDSQVGEDAIHGVVKDMNNYIGVTADGLSGNEYNRHDGTSDTKPQVDTQQIHINLPAIGNMMSEAWDIIHGKKRDNSTVDSLQGRLNFFKDKIDPNEIPVQSSDSEGYLVGSVINGSTSYENSEIYDDNILNVEPEQSHLYDDPWIATSIDTNQGKDGDKDYHRKAISIHHTFHKRKDSTVNELNINNYDGKSGGSAIDSDTKFQKIINKDTIQLYVPKVDKAGHVVGTDIDKVILPYGYKHIKTVGNNISNEATDLDTVPDQVSDDHATVTAGTPIGKTAIAATETQDTVNIDPFNKWIQVKASDDTVEIAHEIHGIVTKAKETDLNNGTNTITFHDLEFDAAGHVEKNQLHTYTLPSGFKTIKIGKQATDSDVSNLVGHESDISVIADNTQDTLTILPANKWVCLHGINDENINGDVIRVGHQVNVITTTAKNAVNLNTASTYDSMTNGNTIKIPDWTYDEAGHITAKQSRTYTLPYGYKQIVATNSTAVNVEPSTVTDKPTADNTQDVLNIKAANKWIKLNTTNDSATDGNSISFAHTLVDTNFGKTYYSNVDSSNTNDNHDRKLDFGSTFKIFNLTTDNAGHITDIDTNDITLPTISLSTSGSGNVVTDMSYSYNSTDKKGTFTETRNNVGSLVLTGYNGASTGNVSNTDTINSAFAKIENKLNTFLQDASVTEGAIDTLKELQEYIDTHTTEAADMVTAINDIYTKDATTNVETGVLIDKTDALNDRINKLNDEQTANEGYYISSIKIDADQLSIDTKPLPIYTLESGDHDGTIKFNGTNIEVKGLGSAAYTSTSEYIRPNTEFVYDNIQENGVETELKTTIEKMAQEIARLTQVLKDNGLITE